MRKILQTLLLILLTASFIGGCCPKLAPIREHSDTSIHRRDSVVITYQTKDDSVTVFVPVDSIIFKDSIPCKNVVYTNKYKTKSLYASVSIRNGILEVDCRTDSLLSVLVKTRDSLVTIRSRSDEQRAITVTKTFKVKVPTPYIPWFFWVCAALVVTWLVIKVYRMWPSISGTAVNLISKFKK